MSTHWVHRAIIAPRPGRSGMCKSCCVKQDISSRDATCFKGDSIEFVRRLLGTPARIYNYLDADAVRLLLNVEQWLAEFMDPASRLVASARAHV